MAKRKKPSTSTTSKPKDSATVQSKGTAPKQKSSKKTSRNTK